MSGPSRALIDEITRFALYLIDRCREDFERRRELIGDDEELIFQIFYGALFLDMPIPRPYLNSFQKLVNFRNLLNRPPTEIDEIVKEAIKGIIEGMTADTVSQFFIDVISIAKRHNNSLEQYIREFTNAKDLEKDVKHLPGIGDVKAPILVRDLKVAGILYLRIDDLNFPPAKPVIRVLKRTGIITKELNEPEEIEKIIRNTFNIPPIIADIGLRHIGSYYCFYDELKCDICPITHVCPKLKGR
ncbi:hypothetical protein DRO49_02720 [Candidatus Bathyarchaeota archaeon]|nr:MAG: hypothetical protein DRO49_02720 [Candidatus Bathyarchaeota archaeon]